MKNKLKAVLLYLWQLPQHLLALLVILATDARRIKHSHRDGIATIFKARRLNSSWSAVSLGEYVLVSHQYRFTDIDYAHEHGHSVQSRRLGWLYLAVIGLPSLAGNLYDRIAHRRWNYARRIAWYYSLPWEAWADRLGGVVRT